MNNQELRAILDLHQKWIKGESGGTRADLSDADLRWTNLSGADLSDADLRGANLSWANLRGANLRRTDLSGANLRRADLRRAVGNGREIKTILASKYHITWTTCLEANVMAIGCEQHLIEDWWRFTDEHISVMDDSALELWQVWKPILQQIISLREGNKDG